MKSDSSCSEALLRRDSHDGSAYLSSTRPSSQRMKELNESVAQWRARGSRCSRRLMGAASGVLALEETIEVVLRHPTILTTILVEKTSQSRGDHAVLIPVRVEIQELTQAIKEDLRNLRFQADARLTAASPACPCTAIASLPPMLHGSLCVAPVLTPPVGHRHGLAVKTSAPSARSASPG